MNLFFEWLGEKKRRRIRLVVMDMWKPFRNACAAHVPGAATLYDKFHALRHLGEAMDQVRRSEYARLKGEDRKFIKGQRYTLLSHRENLSLDGKKALRTLLKANKRLQTAYLLKESFGQLWEYRSESGPRHAINVKEIINTPKYEQNLVMVILKPFRNVRNLCVLGSTTDC